MRSLLSDRILSETSLPKQAPGEPNPFRHPMEQGGKGDNSRDRVVNITAIS